VKKYTLIKIFKISWLLIATLSFFDYCLKITPTENHFEHFIVASLMAILFAILRLVELKEKDLKHK